MQSEEDLAVRLVIPAFELRLMEDDAALHAGIGREEVEASRPVVPCQVDGFFCAVVQVVP